MRARLIIKYYIITFVVSNLNGMILSINDNNIAYAISYNWLGYKIRITITTILQDFINKIWCEKISQNLKLGKNKSNSRFLKKK